MGEERQSGREGIEDDGHFKQAVMFLSFCQTQCGTRS